MSVYIVCSVRDRAVEAYMTPFVVRSEAEGVRVFGEACRDPASPFAKHPNDFELFEVGKWDDSLGVVREPTANKRLATAREVIGNVEDPVQAR